MSFQDPRQPGMPVFMDPGPVVDPSRRQDVTDNYMSAETAEDLFGGSGGPPDMGHGTGQTSTGRRVPLVPGVNMNTPPPATVPVEDHAGPCPECLRKQQGYMLAGIVLGAVTAGSILYLLLRGRPPVASNSAAAPEQSS